ncbi:hypothetical protein HAX54_022518 [Datura stramonium]|uniref:non-specific serine/threonine protein kinase n=1 Tax=Datura stramonium TaxID=4076 RepID=A0ABS8UWJ7_DATST|nr:hypothetical protein [Datura stramonium]
MEKVNPGREVAAGVRNYSKSLCFVMKLGRELQRNISVFSSTSGKISSHILAKLLDLSYNGLSGSFPSWISEPNLQLTIRQQFCAFGVKLSSTKFPLQSRISNMDNETLGPATYFMTSTRRWAISDAGLHSDHQNKSFTSFTSSQFTNTLDLEIFETIQISSRSLRYYILGLENGNYTVTLQFAESEILNPPTWHSLGRRVFNVYVHGILELKYFDIRRAGGRSLTAVQRQFKAQVSENHLEIHLFWAGKGTCRVPIEGTYGPSISAIRATPVFLGVDTRPYSFRYSELQAAASDFYSSNKLGEGGFGPVYKENAGDRI